jgi:sterol desaturase/sphingolipid hydroxylase (fatty acid hydroxylase superfamily)
VLEVFLVAIPFFLLSIVIEVVVLAHHAREEAREAAGRGEQAPAGAPGTASSAMIGYELRDTRTSLAMGVGHLVILGIWKIAIVAVFAVLWTLTPLRVPTDAWWGWVLLFLADDLTFYVWHRSHHRIRFFWATHVVHHSSQHYNLSTALRQDWTPFGVGLFWLWMPLAGFEVWTIFLAQSWSLLYQFGLHTETIGRLPRPIELLFNTPSHHRVHHGSQQQYLDRNYGGILIIWDRLFGTFEPEGERVRYGLTRNIETFNPVRVAFHEYVDIWRDVRRSRRWRDRFGYAFRGPGWRPADPPASGTEPAGAPAAAEQLLPLHLRD